MAHPTPSGPIAHRCFAAVYGPFARLFDRRLGPYRTALVEDIDGVVLDIGAGSGQLFPYLCAAGSDLDRHAIEPDPYMRRRAVRRAVAEGCPIAIHAARAEALPFRDRTIDVALLCFVGCTIPALDLALDEVARVLRPGGELRFIEHVRSTGVRGRVQDFLTPAWRRVAAGCSLNRSFEARIEAHPAFRTTDLERIGVGVFPVAPVVRGTAVIERSESPSTADE